MRCSADIRKRVIGFVKAGGSKAEAARRFDNTGATLLFLPPYSPDLNPIEYDFAALKKRREYNEHLTLDEIIKAYM